MKLITGTVPPYTERQHNSRIGAHVRNSYFEQLSSWTELFCILLRTNILVILQHAEVSFPIPHNLKTLFSNCCSHVTISACLLVLWSISALPACSCYSSFYFSLKNLHFSPWKKKYTLQLANSRLYLKYIAYQYSEKSKWQFYDLSYWHHTTAKLKQWFLVLVIWLNREGWENDKGRSEQQSQWCTARALTLQSYS